MTSVKEQKDAAIIETARTLRGTPWCDEYEKMISGMLYDSLIPPLTNARHECRILAHEYNTMPPTLGTADEVVAKRLEILKRWLGFVGEGVFIEPPFTPDYGCNVIIGKNPYMNFGFTVLDTSLSAAVNSINSNIRGRIDYLIYFGL